MADIARLRILVDMDSGGVVRGAAASTAAIAGFERATTSALSRVTTGFQNLTGAQKGLLGIGTAAVLVGTALSAVVGPAIEFESAFAGVEKTVEGTPSQLAEIRDGILDLSATIPTAANDLADIAANAGQLGVAAPKVLAFTKTVAGLGETTDLSFDSAAQSLARFLNVTGNDADVERLGDVIVELGNNSATTESQILTFGQRLSTAFTLAGAAEQDILALGASMSSLGIEAEAGASALNTSIAVITDAAKLGGRELRILSETAGVTSEEFKQLAADSPVEALILFAEGLSEINAEGRSTTPVLEDLSLNGLRVRRALEALGLGADLARNSLGLANEQIENGGALAEEAGKRYETTAARIDILQNRINRLFITLGTPALDTFAAGADLAGDAIEGLAAILAPLAREGATTFENLAIAAGAFFDVLGEPALQLFVATLVGAAQAATGLLQALNALGPAGAGIAAVLATILLYPQAFIAARTAVAGLALSLQIAGVQGTAAAAGATAFQAALATGPLIIFVAALAAVGKAWIDAGANARASAAAFRESITAAVDASDTSAVVAGLDSIIERQDRLRGVVATAESGEGAWTRFGRAIKGTAQVLSPFTDNTVLNAKRELEALNALLGDLELGNFEESVRLASNALGLSEESIINVARELGVLEQLTTSTTEDFYLAVGAIEAATAAERQLASETDILADKILAGKASLQDYADALGISSKELERLVNRIDSVDLTDFLDGGEDAVRAFDAVESLLAVYEALAEQIGLTSAEYRAQINAVDDLAASHSELRKAIDGAKNALALIEAQQERTNEATVAFDDALASISDTGGLEAAAEALRTLSLEFAGSGVSAAEAAAKQEELYRSFLQAAEGAGIAEDEAIAVAIALGLVPEAVLAEITVEGQAARMEAEEVERQLEQTARGYQATLDADPLGVLNALDDVAVPLSRFVDSDYIAFLEANDVDAQATIDAAQERANAYVAAEYIAILEANGIPAAEIIGLTREDARAYSLEDYVAFLEAEGFSAEEVIELVRQRAQEYASAHYDAQLQATDLSTSTIDRLTEAARTYDGDYFAFLEANDLSKSVIDAAKSNLAGFRDKTITLRANYIPPAPRAGSNIFQRGGIATFEDGGVSTARDAVVRAGVVASPGTADIFTPVTPYRVFAEPPTGGETYIPHRGDRVRNRNIWETTGKMLGFMEQGGISQYLQNGGISGGQITGNGGGSSVFVEAPINIDLANLPAGADLAEVAVEIQRQLSQAFDDLGATILNAQ